MIVYPNAKINLGLNVIKKRVDGYHEIASVFYPVDTLFDILEVIPSDVFLFSSSGLSINADRNICVKAYDLLRDDFSIDPVKIHLHKQIPIGAGLGGGSADGTYTLIILNKLFDLGLSIEQLHNYALKLGADCPFFIENTPKYVRGIGDKMIPVDIDLSKFKLKFNIPKFQISTTDAYTEISPKLSSIDLFHFISKPISQWKDNVINDFELNAFLKYPELRIIKENFYKDGAIYSSMTGSGSVMYGIFNK